jgi:hypothetical protein
MASQTSLVERSMTVLPAKFSFFVACKADGVSGSLDKRIAVRGMGVVTWHTATLPNYSMAEASLIYLACKLFVTPEAEGTFRILTERLHRNLSVTNMTGLAVPVFHGSMNDFSAEIRKPLFVALKTWPGYKPSLHSFRPGSAGIYKNGCNKKRQEAKQKRTLIHLRFFLLAFLMFRKPPQMV